VRQTPAAVRLALQVLLVGFICTLSTDIGFAHKLPPHNISALWPTGAILLSVLVVAPTRHWWVYILAAYFTSIVNDARAGFPIAARLYLAAAVIEVLIAAICVRRFADGVHAFDSLRNLAAYVIGAVVLAPSVAAFVAAFAGNEGYWLYWRIWFLSEALAYLMLAPAILGWIGLVLDGSKETSRARAVEAALIAVGLLAVSLGVFTWPTASHASLPALVYLPLPFILWAAVRFGPRGANTGLLIVAILSVSGAVNGHGPFATSAPAENVLPLQLFLITLCLPLMCLAALVAERRARTSALRESEARFRTMADSAPVLIWMAGPDKLCTFFNRSWLDFTGRTLAQELGEGWTAGIHPDDRERCLATYAQAFDARREFTMEYRLRRHDGAHRWVTDRGVPRRTPEGTFLGYIGCADDITQRRDAELAAERHRAELAHVARLSTMGELAASLAHELNQPLAAILGNAETAQKMLGREHVDFAELREICGDIVSENHRATEVMRRMRALVSKQPPSLAPLDVEPLIRDVVRLVHADAVLRQCRIAVDIAPDLPPVMGDRIELQQVMLNLLLNAFEAMAECPVPEREVRVQAVLDAGRRVKVSVRDRGTGVADGEIERIFEPFRTTKREGLGIGLSISRTIVTIHEGRLWAQNNPDRGATFTFALPVAQPGAKRD
jgi:PAS domain S-box-containing protein